MRSKTWSSLVVLGITFSACGQSGNNPLKGIRAMVLNSIGEDIALATTDEPPKVRKGVVKVGSAPNQILCRGQEALVVSSTTNSLQAVDMEEWKVAREYSLGEGCNPYMMALAEDDTLLVTCFQSNELLRVNPDAPASVNPVIDRLAMPSAADLAPFKPDARGQARPQGVATVGQKAFVTLSNLGEDWKAAGPGLVVVVDLAAWKKTKLIQTNTTNPAAIYKPLKGDEKLYVTCSGAFDGTGTVEVLDVRAEEISTSIAVGGAPGRMFVDEDGIAWVGDQSDGKVLRFETSTGRTLEPIAVCPADPVNGIYDYVSDVATDGRGAVFAACFATDAVYQFDSEQGLSSSLVLDVGDGPIALWVPQR